MTRLRKIDRIREHQANERTFLAWVRTSIAFIGFGFAIARFGLFARQLDAATRERPPIPHPVFNSENLGISLVVLGIVTIIFAIWRYDQIFQQIQREDYQPSRIMVWILAIVIAILGSFTIPLLLLRDTANSIRTQPASRKEGAEKSIPHD